VTERGICPIVADVGRPPVIDCCAPWTVREPVDAGAGRPTSQRAEETFAARTVGRAWPIGMTRPRPP